MTFIEAHPQQSQEEAERVQSPEKEDDSKDDSKDDDEDCGDQGVIANGRQEVLPRKLPHQSAAFLFRGIDELSGLGLCALTSRRIPTPQMSQGGL